MYFNTFNIIIFLAVCFLTFLFLLIFRKKINFKKAFFYYIIGIIIIVLFQFKFNYFWEKIDIENKDTKKYSVTELKQDLKQLEGYILNKNPLYFSDKKEMEKLFKATYNSIKSEMTELEFYRLINPIIAKVNCGHTNLSISKYLVENRKEIAKFLPLEVTLVDNELYVIENYGDKIKKGNKILSINGIDTNEIIDELLLNISADGINNAKKEYIISKFFNTKYYDFIDNSGKYTVELLNDQNETYIVELDGIYNSKYNNTAWSLHFQEYGSDYYSSNIFEDYAILNIKLFSEEKNNKFSKFLKDFFKELNDKNISNLIIDIRGNYGGDPIMSRTLLSYFIKEEIPYFKSKLTLLHKLFNYDKPITPNENSYKGNVVLLTDGSNFSTAGHFTSFFKYYKLGEIIGSRTSGSQVCTDSSVDAVLKNTKMVIRYSRMIYRVNADLDTDNNGVSPDIEVKYSINDILSGNDIVMKKALDYLKIE